MAWEVEYTDEFKAWWNSLDEDAQDRLAATVNLLIQYGPKLDFPFSSKIFASRHSNMRELRTQSNGRPLRTLYAFDPRRCAILLIGCDKTGQDDWYRQFIKKADALYDTHLKEIGRDDHG